MLGAGLGKTALVSTPELTIVCPPEESPQLPFQGPHYCLSCRPHLGRLLFPYWPPVPCTTRPTRVELPTPATEFGDPCGRWITTGHTQHPRYFSPNPVTEFIPTATLSPPYFFQSLPYYLIG